MLEILTLGGLDIRCDGEPVTGRVPRKVSALLVYLACTGRTHAREILAELFWEKRPQERSARSLRVALTSLRKEFGEYVTITRDTVSMNPGAAVWLDAAELEAGLSAGQVEEALELYQGEFLEGFYVRDSRGFEEWLTLERERLHLTILEALHGLTVYHLERGTYREGLGYARRLLQLDPLDEVGHQRMMSLLAYNGMRTAALAHYEGACQLLAEELGVDPSGETTALYDLILAEGLAPGAEAIAPGVPPALPAAELEIYNPYKGLRPFREADAADFFGRESLVQQLVARLGETGEDGRFLAVVGPSGCGKSSAVSAGLLPALRGGVLPGSEGWRIVRMLPGLHPLDELETGLRPLAADPPAGLGEELRRDERGLLRAAQLVLPDDGGELLLVIDQFEEVFTLAADSAERLHLLDLLTAAVAGPRSRVRVVVALRADFYDRPLIYPGFSELVRQRTEVVVPLTAEELARAVASPAEGVGVAYEPELVAEIVADVVEQPGALPLLQYALTQLFEQRTGHTLTLEAYRALGGVQGALGRRAEDLYAGLDPGSQALARQLFLRLVTLGEGTEDTRRRVLRAELLSLGDEPQRMERLFNTFGLARLLTFDRDPLTNGATVEVAHEALLREWGRLGEWLDESRADVRLQRLLAGAAAEWTAAGRDPGFLLRGSRLEQFEGWARETGLALADEERAFLEASLAERDARQAAEAERQARERRLERRSLQRLRIIVGVLIVALAIGLVLTLAVLNQNRIARENEAVAVRSAITATVAQGEAEAEAEARATQQVVAEAEAEARATQQAVAEAEAEARATQQARAEAEANARATEQARAEAEAEARATQQAVAEGQARLATSRELTLAARYNLQVDPERSILLALQAFSLARTTQAQGALRQAVVASRVRLALADMAAGVASVAYSPDGSRLAVASGDGVFVRDAASGETILTLPGEIVAYSPAGARLATAAEDGTVSVWDAQSGRELLTLTGHTAGLKELVFSPDSEHLATASLDDTVRVWDVTTGLETLTLPVRSEPFNNGSNLLFSPGGKYLITVGDDMVVTVWDLATGDAMLALPGGMAPLAISPDGKLLANITGNLHNTVALWDLEASLATGSGQPLLTDIAQTRVIQDMAFSPDGTRLATSGSDMTARIWTLGAEGAQESMTLAGHTGDVTSLAFSPDGKYLATGGWDATARIWDISASGNQEILTRAGHWDWTRRIVYSPDGTRLATTGGDGHAVILDAETGETLLTFSHPSGAVREAVFSPDGTRLATAGEDNTARVWDALNGLELLTLTGHAEAPPVGNMVAGIPGVAFSPDGKLLASAGADGQAILWDAETGERVLALQVHPHGIGVTRVAWSPDGTRLAAASDWSPEGDPLISVWDPASGQQLYTLTGLPNRAWALAFSPDGSRLATGFGAGFVKVYDAATGEESLSLPHHGGRILVVAFSPDGTLLATGGQDPPQLWDLATGQVLGTFPGNTAMVNGLAFSPDGTRLASSSLDGTTRVYTLDLDELVALAQSRLTRWFTLAECQQYLHMDECPPEP
jgi:WD40 repeat protein/DNA-binding SARP family transcriptional activator